MRFEVEGLNLHHKLSFKKPLGGKSSYVRNVVKHPGATILGATTLGTGAGLAGSLLDNANTNMLNKAHDAAAQAGRVPSSDPGQNDADLITQKYGQLATDYQGAADPLRTKLAQSLNTSGGQLFQQENPYILQDLNSRGLFTSSSAVNEAQSKALGEIAAQNRGELNNFDTDVFNQVQNLKATGTGTSLQRLFDVHDQAAQAELAKSLARRRSRDSLISSILGLTGSAGSMALGMGTGGGYGGSYGATYSE